MRHEASHTSRYTSGVVSAMPCAQKPDIRDGCEADLAAVLELNREWEHVTSPVSAEELVRIVSEAALFRVIQQDGLLAAFLLAFTPSADYHSVNYRWFDARGGDFLYIDRVIVSAAAQRGGLGDALYADAIAAARNRGIGRIVCEVDIEPENAASVAFHDKLGFVEVGRQRAAGRAKLVSLRELPTR
jgi:uncharacterized protein